MVTPVKADRPAGTVPAPEYIETADYFAKALDLCGTGAWITVQDAIPMGGRGTSTSPRHPYMRPAPLRLRSITSSVTFVSVYHQRGEYMAASGKDKGGSSGNITLSDDVKAHLRAEEIFREEVRRELRGIWSKASQPIVIWFLSAIVVGAISFGYSNVSESRQKRSLNYERASVVSREISFRVGQVDTFISAHDVARRAVEQLDDVDFHSIIVDNTLSQSGKAIQNYFRTSVLLSVVSDLGGIESFPLTGESATVWIGGSGYGNSALPSGRGYQRDEFKNLSLEDLWIEYHLLMSDQKEVEAKRTSLKEALAAFEEAAEPSDVVSSIPRIAMNALTMSNWSSRSDPDAIKAMIEDVGLWVSEVRDAWSDLSSEVAVDNG